MTVYQIVKTPVSFSKSTGIRIFVICIFFLSQTQSLECTFAENDGEFTMDKVQKIDNSNSLT
jgi:hypothetical protein